MRPKGKGSGGGGRVKGGTEDASRVRERTRSILDAPAAALQSPLVSSRRRRLRPDQMAGLGELVGTLHRCRSSVGVLAFRLESRRLGIAGSNPTPQPTSLDFQALNPLAPSGLTRFWHPGCLHVQCCATLCDAVQRFQHLPNIWRPESA